MRSWPEHADIREVGPRDGLQNEPPVAVAERVRLIDALSATGLARIEAASFVAPTAIPAMAGAEEVMAQITRRPGVVYSALVPNVRGAERAIAALADEVQLVVSASETHNLKNVRRSVAESLVGRARGRGARARRGRTRRSDRLDRVRLPLRGRGRARAGGAGGRTSRRRGRRPALVRRHHRHGDAPQGRRSPRRARSGRDPRRSVGLHFHDTRGTALANVLAALERGVVRFDASIGGLGGCPYTPGASGNTVTEDLVHMLGDLGIDTGIDLDALIECARLAQEIVGRELPSAMLHAGPRLARAAGAA